MKKNRIITVLLLKNGFLVQSRLFSKFQNIGNPISAVKRLSEWTSDELIYLDITRDNHYDIHRDDLRYPNRDNVVDIIQDISKVCHMPITIGGKIRTLEDVGIRLKSGADKVAVNTGAIERPALITEIAKEFGSQCVIVSIDAKLTDGKPVVMKANGKVSTPFQPVEWAKMAEERGAGEILINSIDRDGTGTGYDIELIDSVSRAVKIPVIACGGVGEWAHFIEAFEKTKADAVAAANIFHYSDQSVYMARQYLYERGCLVRKPDLIQA